MKKYLLSLYGTFETKQICKEIATILTPVVDSKHLKFSHKNFNMLFCFESEVERIELHDYIVGALYGMYDYFFLSDIGDNLSVCMDKDSVAHLFDLENESENADLKIDMNKERYNLSEEIPFEESEDYLTDLLINMKKIIRKPSIDEILDKVNDKGIDSITPFEKDILDNYGK